MKRVGFFKGINIYESKDVAPGYVYVINEAFMKMNYPKKKNGRPDMRHRINKLQSVFDPEFKNRIII